MSSGHIESVDVTLHFANGKALRLQGGWMEEITTEVRRDVSVMHLRIVGGELTAIGALGTPVQPIGVERARRLIDLGHE